MSHTRRKGNAVDDLLTGLRNVIIWAAVAAVLVPVLVVTIVVMAVYK